MVFREVRIRQSVAESIADVAWFIESKGMVKTAETFSDEAYDFIQHLAESKRTYTLCREPDRALLGYKCIVYKRKYTIVFIESEEELIICEFIPSKLIHW